VGAEPGRIPLSGIWYRHVRADGDPLGLAPAASSGRWQRANIVGAVYLADSPQTAWAEFYRALAEMELAPAALMPRDLWHYRVALDAVADLTAPATLAQLGLDPAVPDRAQWPAFQAVGERLARDGAQAVLYRSAARPDHRCLCVFAGALDALVALDRNRVDAPPAPPRGMRT
jgi:RES domain-containing protein